ncbi:hypothetical protein ACQEU3_43660 [Spirillospora sp. CA-253888]
MSVRTATLTTVAVLGGLVGAGSAYLAQFHAGKAADRKERARYLDLHIKHIEDNRADIRTVQQGIGDLLQLARQTVKSQDVEDARRSYHAAQFALVPVIHRLHDDKTRETVFAFLGELDYTVDQGELLDEVQDAYTEAQEALGEAMRTGPFAIEPPPRSEKKKRRRAR